MILTPLYVVFTCIRRDHISIPSTNVISLLCISFAIIPHSRAWQGLITDICQAKIKCRKYDTLKRSKVIVILVGKFPWGSLDNVSIFHSKETRKRNLLEQLEKLWIKVFRRWMFWVNESLTVVWCPAAMKDQTLCTKNYRLWISQTHKNHSKYQTWFFTPFFLA